MGAQCGQRLQVVTQRFGGNILHHGQLRQARDVLQIEAVLESLEPLLGSMPPPASTPGTSGGEIALTLASGTVKTGALTLHNPAYRRGANLARHAFAAIYPGLKLKIAQFAAAVDVIPERTAARSDGRG